MRCIGILGATGLVGSEILNLLADDRRIKADFRLYASPDSVGELYEVGGGEIAVESPSSSSFDLVDVLVCASHPRVVGEFAPKVLDRGGTVIDLSGWGELENNECRIVLPGLSDSLALGELKLGSRDSAAKGLLLGVPCAPVGTIASVLAAISELAPITDVNLATYHSVSSAGSDAIDELSDQVLAIYNQQEIEVGQFEGQIAFNSIPQVDLILSNGETREEVRIKSGLAKLLHISPDLVFSTAVRVPIFHGCGVAVWAGIGNRLTRDQVSEQLSLMSGIDLARGVDGAPGHLDASGNDRIEVGRVRVSDTPPYKVGFWAVADNVRTTAALHVVALINHLFAD